MNKIALVEVFNRVSECDSCGSDFRQAVGSSITQWREISDEDLDALTKHVGHLYTERSSVVIVREIDGKQVGLMIDDALERVRQVEAQAEANRLVNQARAAKAAENKEKKDKAKKIKQFEQLQKSLREEGLLKEDGSVKPIKQGKKR